MRLLVDIGNSRLKSAIAHEGNLQALPSVAWREFPIEHWMDTVWLEGLAGVKPDSVLVANVADDALLPTLDAWCCRQWQYKPVVISASGYCAGLRNGYTEPHRLGVDRWAAMLGARDCVAGALCVIDCGTATTVDVIRADGQHIGGAILPGMYTMRRALGKFTAALFPAEGEMLPFANNTADAIAGGTGHALAGAVERLLAEASEAVGSMTVVLTGGEADNLQRLLGLPGVVGSSGPGVGQAGGARAARLLPDASWVVDPMLVLRGIQVCADALTIVASPHGAVHGLRA